MRTSSRSILFFLFVFLFSSAFSMLHAQSNSGSISGTVTDPSGAVIPGASVSIQNPVSAYTRTTTTDNTGHFRFPNLPFNPYHLTVTKDGFAAFVGRCGCRLDRSRHLEYPAEGWRGVKYRHSGGRRRSDRKRSYCSHRRGPRSV